MEIQIRSLLPWHARVCIKIRQLGTLVNVPLNLRSKQYISVTCAISVEVFVLRAVISCLKCPNVATGEVRQLRKRTNKLSEVQDNNVCSISLYRKVLPILLGKVMVILISERLQEGCKAG